MTQSIEVDVDQLSKDAAFQNERAAAFEAHCVSHVNADFEVCTDSRCRAVVIEEARRGLLDPGDIWPPIEPDDKPNYTEELSQ